VSGSPSPECRCAPPLLGLLLPVVLLATAPASGAPEPPDLFDLSLEQLADVPVSSVAGTRQDAFSTPAAVHVIRGEDLRRSGHTSLVEALRMVPGAYVGRVDSNQWATGVRGFGERFYPYLQVLVDGRVVYSEVFSGVNWDVQNPFLEDVETIEVIRGPGATLWGANAVNGVINVTTRSARDTTGTFGEGGGGDEERAFGAARHGGELADGIYGRAWGYYRDRDGSVYQDGSSRPDDWSVAGGGVRIDGALRDRVQFSLQGEGYTTPELGSAQNAPQLVGPPDIIVGEADAQGGYGLLRVERESGSDGFRVQAYYDRVRRETVRGFRSERDTADVDYRQHTTLAGRHALMWGLGYRYRHTSTRMADNLGLDPSRHDTHLVTGFIQDTITLVDDRLFAMLGTKLEHNSFTGFEIQPSLRAWWTPTDRHTVWAAVSRPVRTPSLIQQNLVSNIIIPLPGGGAAPAVVLGNDGLDAETLLAYELGFRMRPLPSLLVDVAAFYFDYDELTVVVPTATPGELRFENQGTADNLGAEVALTWRAMNWLRFEGSYSYLHVDTDDVGQSNLDSRDPEHQFQLRSYLDVTPALDLFAGLYFVDQVRAGDVPSYFRLDAGVAWRPTPNVELSFVGQNLTESRHLESTEETTNDAPAEIERSLFGRLTLRF
jgi:iron complex outermembrane receptor protein